MDFEKSITDWIHGMRQGDDVSVQRIWERYFEKLVQIAGQRLPARSKRAWDEEDIALSAFHSLYQGIVQGRFPRVDDRNNLWSLLVVITARKASHAVRDAVAQKRGGGKVVGESAFGDAHGDGTGICSILGEEPTPEFATMVSEQCERLLAALPDDNFRRLVVLKLEGFSNQDIAMKLNWGQRTVERRLGLVRKLWTQADSEFDEAP